MYELCVRIFDTEPGWASSVRAGRRSTRPRETSASRAAASTLSGYGGSMGASTILNPVGERSSSCISGT
jgi:hypothetical protein